jgi:hypothetical protein
MGSGVGKTTSRQNCGQAKTERGGRVIEEEYCHFVVAERELAIQETVGEMDSGTHSE